MGFYRNYLRYNGQTLARDEFEAPDDEIALAAAEAICDALADRCNGFELWDGGRRVRPRDKVVDEIRDEIVATAQGLVIAREEAIQAYGWGLVSSSSRLDGQLKKLKNGG